ncbi:MAG: hypothetical protein IKB09_13700 [Oscillospiraceae bacterium]|nr:hypothetical protein [Oscillospiraceae bacterium]
MDELTQEYRSEESIVSEQEAPVAQPRPRPARRRSKQQVFKENTLPLIILVVSGLLIVTFIVGSIVRAVQKHNIEEAASIAASESVAAEEARLTAEMEAILKEAEKMVAGYDYDGAIALIDSFSGNIGAYPQLQDAKVLYDYTKSTMVAWADHNAIVNLSFQTLIADPARAYADPDYSSSLKQNFVTVSEFEKILERLYANDYVLVGPRDFIETVNEGGKTIYKYKEILLPEGKKPIVLTQTNVNYNLYLVDSDDDMIADQGGSGIASKLLLQSDGSITCEMVDSSGNITTGAYDLVPILDAFVEKHPDFSYHGSKAVLALTGYNGLFGYRTHAAGREALGEETYQKDVESVKAIAEALKESGYELACYTYENKPYGIFALSEIQVDMNKWNEEVVPILGNLDIIVFAQNSDINNGILYSGEKYDYLKSLGFNYFLGFCNNGDSFTFIADEYVRQGRVLVTGETLIHKPDWFNGIFDTDGLMDEARN